MNPQLFAKMLKQYQDRMTRAGQELPENSLPPSGITAQTEGSTITVRISGPLDGGWLGVSAADVIKKLDNSSATDILLLINSPGGFVDEGMALYSDLRARVRDKGATVRTESRGLVASAAIMPYLAGDTRTAAEGSLFMVHNSWSYVFAVGDYDDIKKQTNQVLNGLEATTKLIRDIIADRTDTPQDDVKAQLDAETWFTSAEAVAAGYANEVVEEQVIEDEEDQTEVSDEVLKLHNEAKQRVAASVLNRFRSVA